MAENKASFGRKWLSGIIRNDDLSPEEKESMIMEGHIGVTDGLKDRIEELKAEADKVPGLEKQLSEASGEDWKAKAEKAEQDLKDYKAQVAKEADAAKIEAACEQLAIDAGISAPRAKTVVQAMKGLGKLKDLKLDKDGNIEGADAVKEAIGNEWAEFKTTVTTKGATVEKPPQSGKPKMSKEEILAITDTNERHKAIAENHEIFGF